MQTTVKKTGGVLYFEPLRVELNDCFGALKDVSPDQIYSNHTGMEEGNGSNDSETVEGVQPSTSNAGDKSESGKKKKKKSNYDNFYYNIEIFDLLAVTKIIKLNFQLVLHINNIY